MSHQAVSNAKKLEWPLKEISGGVYLAEAPGGYKFYLEDRESPKPGEGPRVFCLSLLQLVHL